MLLCHAPEADVLLILSLFACTPDPTETGGTSTDTAELSDSASDSADSAGDSGDSLPTICADGAPPVPWADAVESEALRDLAADFVVETEAGEWRLSEHWSGCDNYLIIPSEPTQTQGTSELLWYRRTDTEDLFARLPENTYLIFVSNSSNDEDRALDFEELQDGIERFENDLSEEEVEALEARIVRASSGVSKIGGWLEESLQNPGWGVGIDRFQRIRYVGSFANPERYNSNIGWFDSDISMAANEAIYYNFEATRQAALDEVNATVISLFAGEVISDPGWAGVVGKVTVELPDAATMATFDTMEWDHSLLCEGEGEYGYCPAWDYLNWLWLCDSAGENCNTEVGRWITTYHREGRWVHDMSAALPLFAAGGSFTFAYYTQQPYEVWLDMRLSNVGKSARPDEMTTLFGGGGATATYNDRDPIVVNIPADAQKVELAIVFSGHGQVDSPENCAEFCNFDHHFGVNGTDNQLEFPEAGSGYGCMEQVNIGTVPNQYGTWWYGRNGWCPGLEVPVRTLDVTAQINLGADNSFTYAAYKEGAPYDNGGANLLLTSWVVVSK